MNKLIIDPTGIFQQFLSKRGTDSPVQQNKAMYYSVWKSTVNSNWYWNLKSANHEKIAQSEGYTTKASALHAIDLLKSSSAAPVHEV